MKKVFAGIALFFLSAGIPALAADMVVKAPKVAPAPLDIWTGFYVGGHLGGLWTRADSIWDPRPAVFGNLGSADNLKGSGFVGGVHAGYNWRLAPMWVVGIEADWSWTSAQADWTRPWVTVAGVVRPAALTAMSLDASWLATVRGRVGYLVAPNALVYVTGGGAWGSFDYAASASNEAATYVAATAFSKTASGYVLGGGVEWAFVPNWFVRGEYLFYHLQTASSVSIPDRNGNFPLLPSAFAWSDVDIHAIRAAVSYRFGG